MTSRTLELPLFLDTPEEVCGARGVREARSRKGEVPKLGVLNSWSTPHKLSFPLSVIRLGFILLVFPV